jgi:hypothetical protein
MTRLLAAFTLLALSTSALSAPTTETFTVRVKMDNPKGGVDFVPVGQIERANGKVTAKGFAAPALDKLSDDFVAAWKAHKWPASVEVSESISEHTGMRPEHKVHKFTFTKTDRLYAAAVIKQFIEKRNLEALGMSTVRFIEFDSTPEYPPGAHDRASQHINFRKGTKIDDDGGYTSFYIKQKIRTPSMGTPDYVLRPSKTEPALAVAQNFDDGTATIAIMKAFPDGHVDVEPWYAGTQFEGQFGGFGAADEYVWLIRNGTWIEFKISKKSPLLLEAQIIGNLEHRHYYDVTPPVDPKIFKK